MSEFWEVWIGSSTVNSQSSNSPAVLIVSLAMLNCWQL